VIISKTPFRISFFGGGTDYPAYYLENGGSVIATAIDKYCYISLRNLPPFFEHKYRIVYSKIDNAKTIDEIEHPAVRGILQYANCNEGLEIHHDGDLPARSGLGSSSSFTVGLLNALNSLNKKECNKMDLALEAIELEQNILNEAVGSQDQVSAAFGGLNRINFNKDGSIQVIPLSLDSETIKELDDNLLLFYTGITRFSYPFAQKKINNVSKNLSLLERMTEMVNEGEQILSNQNTSLREFGLLMHEGWLLKRGLANGVSTAAIDEMYQSGIDAGAVGGKLLGAGGGGFIVFYVEKRYQKAVINRLHKYIHVPFHLNSEGSEIILEQSEEI
tara:strand:- start:2751 stop:3746 length:996 start_codon:yes stop_codon:yes gene_type:complete